MKELLSIDRIKEILELGEDSLHQFKLLVNNEEQMAEIFVSFLNMGGGYVLIGINDKDNSVEGLTPDQIRRQNQIISNAASENVVPPFSPFTENKIIDDKRIIVIYIQEGKQKPYKTKSGKYLQRVGSDKRIMDTEQIGRLIQDKSHSTFEEDEASGTSWEEDLDRALYYSYFEKFHRKSVQDHIDELGISMEQLLRATSIIKNAGLTNAGLICFCANPQMFKPSYSIDFAHFPRFEKSDDSYIHKEKITGPITILFRRAIELLKLHLIQIKKEGGFNSRPEIEIHEYALEEALVNALVHRNYSINSTIKIFIFQDRVEIQSPGKLFNSLSIASILSGESRQRNPKIAAIAAIELPYSGLGSGISRIRKHHPDSQFINDVETDQFKVIFKRKSN